VSEEQVRPVRRRRSGAEVEKLVAAYEASGLGRTEFCRTHGLTLSTLNRYCKRQQAHCEASGVGRWVAVELSDPNPAAGSGGSSGLTVILSSGRRIAIGRSFDASTLERLLVVLERV
jgi:transposase